MVRTDSYLGIIAACCQENANIENIRFFGNVNINLAGFSQSLNFILLFLVDISQNLQLTLGMSSNNTGSTGNLNALHFVGVRNNNALNVFDNITANPNFDLLRESS